MNIKLLIRSIGILAVFSLFWQCASVPDTHYYFLEFETKPAQNAKPAKFDLKLMVADFTAKPFYQENSIVYRENLLEGKRYHYHRWAEPPAQMFKNQLVESLKNSGLFSNIIDKTVLMKADYLLTGEILAIEEVDRGSQWFGRVKVDAHLIETGSNSIVWSNRYEVETPVAKKEPLEVVKSINASAEKCVNQIVSELDKFFSEK